MSEQSVDMLPDYWNEMLKLHWEFIEEEDDESFSKSERKRTLESSINKFLSLVPYDRKFFLPETECVLRKSITEMENFSANNAIKGFEGISEYANNLCKKPWRKEYRTIKMYSGYYHHEIQKNLVFPEYLFLAMGYKNLGNDKLVLNEAICPDQVANVSRDCIIAYVECKFLNRLKDYMEGQNLSTTWNDIYNIRRHTIGDFETSVSVLTQYLLMKEQKQNIGENMYATIKYNQDGHLSNMVSNCINCANPLRYIHSNDCAIRRGMQPVPLPPMGTQCSIHKDYNLCQAYSTASQQIPHSKSLEHYNHESCAQYQIPHRHSLDLPNQYETLKINKSHIYERPYDSVDGHFLNSAIFQHQNNYHIPGNRNPLPITFTNQYFPPSSSPPLKPPSDIYCNHNGYSSRGNKEFTNCIEQNIYPPISAEQQFNEFSSSYKKQQSPASLQQLQNTNRSSGHGNSNSNFSSTETNNIKYPLHSKTQYSQKLQQKKLNKGFDNNYKASNIIATSASDSYEELSEKKRSVSGTRNEEGVGYFGNWDYVYQSLGNDKQQNDRNEKSSNLLQQQPFATHHQFKEKKNKNANKSNPTTNIGIRSAKGSPWTCTSCTYENKNKSVICLMCAASKKHDSTDSFNKPTCV